MKFGVVVFPGSNGDNDIVHILGEAMSQEVIKVWHGDAHLSSFSQNDCIILPGGFSYGDHLRPGAIARYSTIMEAVLNFAKDGGYVWGIGNGFQILCEAGLLPGALLPNQSQLFSCKNVYLKVITNNSAITASIDQGMPLKIPIAHGQGRFYANKDDLQELRDNDQILFRYCTQNGDVIESANPNGSLDNIAGICNLTKNVFGMMPHPERAAEEILGNIDGRVLFDAMLAAARLNL